MKQVLLTAVAFFLMATLTFAQDKPDSKVQPMFGGGFRTEQQQKEDEKFLKSCDASFTSRTEASKFFMERGWEYFSEGKIDTAMYRFNLAWLLNPGNGDTYWAFGLISAATDKPKEALKLYEKALEYEPGNSLLLSDVASAHILAYKSEKKKKHLKNASKTLDKALKLDQNNSFALYSISEVKYLEKKYSDAWTYLHQAREIDMLHLNYSYLQELMEKMPDPTGFFSNKTGSE
jgi:tetratricopeptide (TPR) repeat protein